MKGKEVRLDYSGSYRIFDGILAVHTNGVNSTGSIGSSHFWGRAQRKTVQSAHKQSSGCESNLSASVCIQQRVNNQHQFAPLVFIECEAIYGPFRTGIIAAQNTHKCTVCFTADIWQHKRCDASPTLCKLGIFILISWICRQ